MTNHRTFAWIIVLVLIGAGMARAEENSLVLRYDKPAANWQSEALPIGNGRLGGMVFGGVATERIAMNEDTLWSGEPKEWDNPDAKQWLLKVRETLFDGDFGKASELCKPVFPS